MDDTNAVLRQRQGRRQLLTSVLAGAGATLLLSAGGPARAAKRTVTITSVASQRPPYEIYDKPEEYGRGIYPDLMREIGKRTDTTFVYNRLPLKRSLVAMRTGGAQLEVGISPSWRSAPEDAAISLYSKMIHKVEDVVIFRKGEGFPVTGPADLKGRKVVATHGFYYAGSETFTRIDVYSEAEVLRSLVRPGSTAQCALLDRLVALYYIREEKLPLEIGGLHFSGDGFMRLHNSLADWLPKLDGAIDSMHADGSMAKLIARYTMAEGIETRS